MPSSSNKGTRIYRYLLKQNYRNLTRRVLHYPTHLLLASYCNKSDPSYDSMEPRRSPPAPSSSNKGTSPEDLTPPPVLPPPHAESLEFRGKNCWSESVDWRVAANGSDWRTTEVKASPDWRCWKVALFLVVSSLLWASVFRNKLKS